MLGSKYAPANQPKECDTCQNDNFSYHHVADCMHALLLAQLAQHSHSLQDLLRDKPGTPDSTEFMHTHFEKVTLLLGLLCRLLDSAIAVN
jgi:hypothetical protein